MNYHGLEKTSLVNGDGIRTVLWVAGCNHHCAGCQNPDTWDPEGGEPFDLEKDYEAIRDLVSKPYRHGLTLSGGDPMYPENRAVVYGICKRFRADFGDSKNIWLYTGYRFAEITDDPILDLVDVIVDGEYIESQRNVNRQWCGSENQVIWRKQDGKWIAEEPKYAETIESRTGMDM